MNETMNSPANGPPDDRKWKAVFTIIENQGKGGNRDRKYWLRIGIAFINHDGSMNVRLDAMPVNGMLHIRDQPAPNEARSSHRDDAGLYAQKGIA